MLSVTSIESCVVRDEYKNLVLYGDYRNLLSVTSIESCVVCDEYRNLVLSMASIETFVLSVASIGILCCVWRV